MGRQKDPFKVGDIHDYRPPYSKQELPRLLYKTGGKTRLVETQEELDAAEAKGWLRVDPDIKRSPPEGAGALDDDDEDPAAGWGDPFEGLNVEKSVDQVNAVEKLEVLDRLESLEQAGRNRVGVLKAIAARREVLKAEE